jgi:glycosyltransferase involved in cell wall biosynthesis
MDLSYLIPENQYEFFQELPQALRDSRINTWVNTIPDSTDVILAGILPITHEWYPQITRFLALDKPVILWHWDLYSFTNYEERRWQQFLDLMIQPRVTVWSCSYDTARQLKQVLNVDSEVVPAWVNGNNWDHLNNQSGEYAVYATGGGGFGKRIDWAELACKLLDMPLKVIRNQELSRNEYFQALYSCKFYLMTAFEESNGSIPAMEAAAIGKPIVLASTQSNLEVFGTCNGLHYFSPWDFQDLKNQIVKARRWSYGPCYELADRMFNRYSLPVVAQRIIGKLKVACAKL